MTLEAVKSYLRVTDDSDDRLLSDIIMPAAEEYVAAAAGRFDESRARVRVVYLAVIQDLYDNRALIAASGRADRSMIKSSIFLQLFAEELAESEGGNGSD